MEISGTTDSLTDGSASSSHRDELLLVTKLPDCSLINSAFTVSLEFYGRSSESVGNNVRVQVKAHELGNESVEFAVEVSEVNSNLPSMDGSAGHVFSLPESRRLTLSIKLTQLTDGRAAVLKFIAQSNEGRKLASVQSTPIQCVKHKLVVDDNFSENYDIAPGQSNSDRLFYNAKGGKDKGIKFKISLVDFNGDISSINEMELKVTLLYEGSNLTVVDNQQILQADQKKIQLMNGEAIVKLRISEVSQKHQGKRFRIKFERATIHGELSNVAPGFSEAIEVRSKINYQNKRNAASLPEPLMGQLSAKKSKPEPQVSSLSTIRTTFSDIAPAVMAENLAKVKLRCDKIKANLSLVRKYLNQSNEILLGTIPVLDADRADVVEKFSASYDQMRQIMSQLLQDQFAIQSYLDELDLSNVQVPTQNTEVVDDQSDAARMLMSLSNLSTANPRVGSMTASHSYPVPSYGLDNIGYHPFPHNTVPQFSSTGGIIIQPNRPGGGLNPPSEIRFDEDQQVRMIYLGQITHGFVGKGVPALKKVADKWIMAGLYSFVTVERVSNGTFYDNPLPDDKIIPLEKSQFFAVSKINTTDSYTSANRAEAILRINKNPKDHANVKIDVDFYLIDDVQNKRKFEFRKKLNFQSHSTLPPEDVAKIATYCSNHSDLSDKCILIENLNDLSPAKQSLAEKFALGMIQSNTFPLDEKKVRYYSKRLLIDANNVPIGFPVLDKDKKKIGAYVLQRHLIPSSEIEELQRKVCSKQALLAEEDFVPIERVPLLEEMALTSKYCFVIPLEKLDHPAEMFTMGSFDFIGYSKPHSASNYAPEKFKISKFCYSLEFSTVKLDGYSVVNMESFEEVFERQSLDQAKKSLMVSFCSNELESQTIP